MNSRQAILNAIRRQEVSSVEQPPADGPWTIYDEPREKFVQVLEAIGGTCVSVPNEAAIVDVLCQQPEFTAASRVYSSIADIKRANVDVATIEGPHALEDVDFAILRGEFCVAENGSIWVTNDGVPQRVIYFATQHLALVVPASEIVSNMHQAYERLTFTQSRFGTFIAGPSKTADIEQSLVIGAHGSRSLTAILVGG